MPERTIMPELSALEHIHFEEANTYKTPGGNIIYYLHQEGQEGLRMDLLFDAGSKLEKTPGSAKAALSQIFNGTVDKTAAEIAEGFDFYGSYLDKNMGPDRSSISIYLLNKHRNEVFELLQHCLQSATHPGQELEIYKRNAFQKLKVEEQKNGFLARRAFFSRLFGPGHFYGKHVSGENILALDAKQTSEFYGAHFQGKRPKVMLAGGIQEDFLKKVSIWLDQQESTQSSALDYPLPTNYEPRLDFIDKPDSLQAAVFVGRTLFNRHHPDYAGLAVLNTALGGYFGSRLMSNIREEKGYTYGIYSRLMPLEKGGCFYISSEVRNENWKDTLREIDHELTRLCEQPIGEQELNAVKQFMLGNLLRSTDGPFSLADNQKMLLENNLGIAYYQRFNQVILDITATELQSLAQRYLAPEHLIQTVIGTT